eukprot:Anaeramoba_ignava/c16933_g1_i1.p1 GENE.c16933_g1_i1~~c16933_g1_i1.p1  ORF type:complete len:157 (+),score=24.98 c16933_g1_i1:1121-1591(+)
MNSLKSHWRICVSNAVGLSDFRNRIWNWIDHHCGVHEFCTEFSQNPKCTEPEFRDTQSKIEDTQTRERLEIFLDKEFSPEQLEKYLGNFSTSIVESFNSTIWPFCPKNLTFQKSYYARISLAILRWNFAIKYNFLPENCNPFFGNYISYQLQKHKN